MAHNFESPMSSDAVCLPDESGSKCPYSRAVRCGVNRESIGRDGEIQCVQPCCGGIVFDRDTNVVTSLIISQRRSLHLNIALGFDQRWNEQAAVGVQQMARLLRPATRWGLRIGGAGLCAAADLIAVR